MKLTKKQLELKSALQKEWLITNGIGGYASSTVLGANTRRYHGLLVAPLNPPARRHLILSKLDESIEIENEKYNLYTNLCRNYIAEGYKNLESFEQNPLPEFVYKVQNVKIVKKISMIYGENTVVVHYEIKNNHGQEVKMTIAPILNFRDFHAMTTNYEFQVNQEIGEQVKITMDENPPIYMKCTQGNYIEHHNDTFKNMYYLKEEERGFFPEEDLCVPGRYEIVIEPKKKKEITIVVSLDNTIENINAKEVFEQETRKIRKNCKTNKVNFEKSEYDEKGKG